MSLLDVRLQDPERVAHLTAEMFERRNYPKLKERKEREKKQATHRRIKVSEEEREKKQATHRRIKVSEGERRNKPHTGGSR